MERCPIRIGSAAVVCLLMAAIAPGCNALGLGKGKDAHSGQLPFYDEFFSQDDEEVEPSSASADEKEESARLRFFKRNRLPGGLSPEAREIEQNSFNIY